MAHYQNPTTGEISNITDVSLAASAARTATGNGTAVDVGDLGTLRLKLDITASSGTTPTLDVTIETRFDSGDSWRSMGTFAQQTGNGTVRKAFSGCDRQARATWTIGGTTPSFTFSITGEAV